MQLPLTPLLCAAVFGAALSGTYALLSSPPSEAAPRHASLGGDAADALAALRRSLTELEASVTRLDGRIASVEAGPHGPTRIDPSALEAIARQVFAELSGASNEGLEPTDAALSRRAPIDEVLADVLAADDVQRAALWKQLAEEGRADEVLEAMRLRAEEAPSDPDKQVELGQAYIARIAEVGNSPLAGTYAMQADAAFERALAVDPQHYEARFTKAVSLSFWPPVFGKQAAAIEQFEILIAQHSTQSPKPRFAETHLLLGNMYQQTGQRDRALAAWRNGAALFPAHEGLAQQLRLASQ